MQCIFCQIVQGNVPSKKIYEDEKVVGVLDIYPAAEGHILLAPKEHCQFLEEIDEDLFAHMGMVAARLATILVVNLKAEGISLIVQDGANAGQKAPHFILHLIPRKTGDGLNFSFPRNPINKKEIEEIYAKLKPLVRGGEKKGVIKESGEKEVGAEEDKKVEDKEADCPFCIIAKGESKNIKILYQDNELNSFLFPTTVPGHTAIIPKKHFPVVMKTPEQIVGKVFVLAHRLVKMVKQGLQVDSVNIIVNIGIDQDISHFSLHILPRKQDDNLSFIWQPKQVTEEQLSSLESKLKGPIEENGKVVRKQDSSDIESGYLVEHLKRVP